jgi:hypothetical protein
MCIWISAVLFTDSISQTSWTLSPGHTPLYGLIMTKARQNVISREADKIKQIKQNNLIDYFYFLFLISTFN